MSEQKAGRIWIENGGRVPKPKRMSISAMLREQKRLEQLGLDSEENLEEWNRLADAIEARDH